MKSGTATKHAQINTRARRSGLQTRESQKTKAGPREAEPQENESAPASDFLVGALLYSLFVSGNASQMLPDGDGD